MLSSLKKLADSEGNLAAAVALQRKNAIQQASSLAGFSYEFQQGLGKELSTISEKTDEKRAAAQALNDLLQGKPVSDNLRDAIVRFNLKSRDDVNRLAANVPAIGAAPDLIDLNEGMVLPALPMAPIDAPQAPIEDAPQAP